MTQLKSNSQPTDLYLVIYLPCLTDPFRQNLKNIDICLLKQVAKLFQKIQEMIEEENNLVFVLIGEICDDIMFFNIQY